VEDLCLDFGDFMKNGENIAVSNNNKMDYIERKIQYELVECRQQPLATILEGFGSIDLTAHLALFSHTELRLLTRGPEHISAEVQLLRLICAHD
jgi:hypothetical protein